MHPKCTECGTTTTSFLQDFQKRMTGFLSNFVVDYMCDPCYKKRRQASNVVEYLKEYTHSNDLTKSARNRGDMGAAEPDNDNRVSVAEQNATETVLSDSSSGLESSTEFLDDDNVLADETEYDGYMSDDTNYFGDSDSNMLATNYEEPETKKEPEIRIEATNGEIVERDKLETYYFCIECQKLFPSLQFLKDHGHALHNPYRMSKSVELPFKCSDCGQSFGRENALKHHTKENHNLFMCSYCAESFATERQLTNHETLVHYAERNGVHPSETFRCLVCSYTYGMYYASITTSCSIIHVSLCTGFYDKLMRHVKVRHENVVDHVADKPKRSLSPAKPNAFFYKIIKERRNCVLLSNGKSYADNFAHIIEEHANQPVPMHHCPKCTFSCQTSNELNTHLAAFVHDIREHPPSALTIVETVRTADATTASQPHHLGQYNCEYCPKVFVSAIMRDTHLRYRHNSATEPLTKNQHHCRMCNKWYSTKQKLSNHNWKYHRQSTLSLPMRYECRICSKDFQLQRFRAVHEQSVHRNAETQRYHCTVCPETFKHPFNLQGHTNVHNELTPFVCEYCGRAFTMAKYLRIHRNKHTHEREFICEICQKRFNFKSNLSNHMLMHSDAKVKKYACNECDRSFADQRDFQRHRYQQHSNAEKEFGCHKCSYRAYMQTDLHKHLRTVHRVYQNIEANKRIAHRSLKILVKN